MIVLSRSKNAASMTFIVSVAGSVPEQGRSAPNAPGPRIRCAQSVEVRRYPRSRRRQGTWWAPRSSKPVCGRELAGGFDSRPPPLLNEASDQPLREEGGVGRPRKGLDRSSGDRVYHTSLSVFASRDTGRVFRPPNGRPDNPQPPSSRRRGVRASTTSPGVNPAHQLSCESDPLNRSGLVDAVARGQPVWWRKNSAPLLEAGGVDREPARCRPPRQPAPRCPLALHGIWPGVTALPPTAPRVVEDGGCASNARCFGRPP
jgi:hypothetical protein